MNSKIKIVFIFFIFLTQLYANSVYDINILTLQSKVFPKVILADNNISEKILDNNLSITILYEEIDTNIAIKFKKMIELNYPKLKEYDVLVKLLEYKNFSSNAQLDSAYIFLLGEKKDIIDISKITTDKNRLSFCYDKSYIESGVIFGLEISSTVSLLLNLNNLKQSKITLENSIFNVAKIK